MKKPYLIFFAVALAINLFLYFYPADIFQVQTSTITKDVTLKSLFDTESLYTFSNVTIKGWALLLIGCIGIPIIIAWRSTLTKYDRKTGDKKDSIYDRFK